MNIFQNTDLKSDAIRFLGAGGFNTILTILIYQLFLILFTHNIAYALSWLFGLLFLITFYPSKVFVGSKNNTKNKLRITGIYLSIFCIGLWSLDQLVSTGIHERLAIFLVLVITTLLNFTFMRLALRGI